MMRVLMLMISMGITQLYGLSSTTFTPPNLYLQALTAPGPNGNLHLAVADNGMAIAVWTNFPNQIEIQAAFYNGFWWQYLDGTPAGNTNNGTLFNNILVNGTFIAFGSAPQVGIDQFGNATIVYVSSNNQIVANRYTVTLPPPHPVDRLKPLDPKNTNLVLSSTTQLTANGTMNGSPTLAVSPNNTALVVWIQNAPYQVLSKSFNPAPGGGWTTNPVVFMPITVPNIANVAGNSFGTYPGELGISNTNGVSIWTDGASGVVNAGVFPIP